MQYNSNRKKEEVKSLFFRFDNWTIVLSKRFFFVCRTLDYNSNSNNNNNNNNNITTTTTTTTTTNNNNNNNNVTNTVCLKRCYWSYFSKIVGQNVCVGKRIVNGLRTGDIQFRLGLQLQTPCNVNGLQRCVGEYGHITCKHGNFSHSKMMIISIKLILIYLNLLFSN